LVFLAVSAAACGDDDDDAQPADAGADGGADTGTAQCVADSDCSDDIFCNGAERCDPTAGAANGRGCVVTGTGPCAAELTCSEDLDVCQTVCEGMPDADGDGRVSAACVGGDDCDDDDAARFPGNDEICDDDGHDEDCNDATYGSRDGDADGFIDAVCCNGTTCGEDCNDARRDIKPGASEVCNGLDDDCSGEIDEGVAVDGYVDRDFDGYGPAEPPLADGGVDAGALDAGELDGGAATARLRGCPGARGFAQLAGDCNDANAAQNPGLLEACDLLDNDCDGVVDNNTTSVNWYRDSDGDGFGDLRTVLRSCVQPVDPDPTVTYRLFPFDCDDTRISVNIAAPEICDGRDNDCNGRADFLIAGSDTEDDDRDGSADIACSPGGDCRDTDARTYPGAPELCDDRDNDCDGVPDDGTSIQAWYLDADGDGQGSDVSAPIMSCPPIAGRATTRGDCDDADASRRAGIPETCNGIDDDCNGLATGEDLDGDRFRALGSVCVGGPREARPASDCDDSDAMVNPGRAEAPTCDGIDGIDSDCNGVVDDGISLLQRSNANCGACGSVCAAGEACYLGTCHPAVQRVFVTAEIVLANFGGARGGDAVCQARANAQALGGTWRSWTSDNAAPAATSPSTRFSVVGTTDDFVTLRGTTIATSWADLTDGNLAAAIDSNERGEASTAYEVWTATRTNGAGQGGLTGCANFTSRENVYKPYDFPSTGSASTGAAWTTLWQQQCSRDNVRLYCFEQ